MLVFAIAIATFFSTLFGGLFALRLKDKLHLILGFSAGAVIGVAFFDLMPEALNLSTKLYALPTAITAIALGFLLYLAVDRFVLLHTHDDDEHGHALRRGALGAGSLSFHSFLDGVGIGLAFKVSPAIGTVVALAVLTHDFSDGINTVNLVLKNKGERGRAFRWLLVDAVAPVVGVTSTLLFSIPEERLGLLLALFSGFFLYIGAADLVPESHHAHPTRLTTVMTVAGAALIYIVVHLANI